MIFVLTTEAASLTDLTVSAGLLYDWLYPAHFPALRCSLQAWADDPEVTNIILKFLAEFVWNKTSRLAFDSCSANGILLFREVSQVTSFPVKETWIFGLLVKRKFRCMINFSLDKTMLAHTSSAAMVKILVLESAHDLAQMFFVNELIDTRKAFISCWEPTALSLSVQVRE